MIFGPKDNGTYVVEFRTTEGEAPAISIPRTEAQVIRHFQERMPYGLFVPPHCRLLPPPSTVTLRAVEAHSDPPIIPMCVS